MAEVRWTPQAADDLDSICLFIARDAPPMAAIFADRVLRATDKLAHFPRMGRVVPELGTETVREIFVSSYRLIYRLKQDTVQVLTLHHGARILDARTIDLGA